METLTRQEAAPARVTPSQRRKRGPEWATIVVFLVPGLVLFGTLVLAPIVLAAYTSLYDWNGLEPLDDFIGLGNFTRMFTDPVFLGDLWHALFLIVMSLLVQLPLALGLALLLNQKIPGRAVFRLLFFAPYILSEVIAGVLFSMIFSPTQGLANSVKDWIGLDSLETTWLADPDTVLFWVFFAITWKYFGLHMILYLAGRQGIPEELVEAAQIDGAGSWKTFVHVTLPLLGPTIRISVFLSILGTLQLFDMVWVLTEGGPPVSESETMAVTMYRYGFERFEVGYASAISVVMFLICMLFALLYQRFVMRRDLEGAVTGMRDQR